MTVKKHIKRYKQEYESTELTALWFVNNVLKPQIISRENDLEELKKVKFDTGDIKEAIFKLQSQIKFLETQMNFIVSTHEFEQEI